MRYWLFIVNLFRAMRMTTVILRIMHAPTNPKTPHMPGALRISMPANKTRTLNVWMSTDPAGPIGRLGLLRVELEAAKDEIDRLQAELTATGRADDTDRLEQPGGAFAPNYPQLWLDAHEFCDKLADDTLPRNVPLDSEQLAGWQSCRRAIAFDLRKVLYGEGKGCGAFKGPNA